MDRFKLFRSLLCFLFPFAFSSFRSDFFFFWFLSFGFYDLLMVVSACLSPSGVSFRSSPLFTFALRDTDALILCVDREQNVTRQIYFVQSICVSVYSCILFPLLTPHFIISVYPLPLSLSLSLCLCLSRLLSHVSQLQTSAIEVSAFVKYVIFFYFVHENVRLLVAFVLSLSLSLSLSLPPLSPTALSDTIDVRNTSSTFLLSNNVLYLVLPLSTLPFRAKISIFRVKRGGILGSIHQDAKGGFFFHVGADYCAVPPLFQKATYLNRTNN